ncbi:L,D-transpeptidase [Demequina salsinemoris]|uniref:L,D-transpeptidase n=1 Tax=Demequina salsinemoris TaxID=577470 RepID=UPI0007803FBD|nr:L,D-transpeptidase [Demequina salsinemoris]
MRGSWAGRSAGAARRSAGARRAPRRGAVPLIGVVAALAGLGLGAAWGGGHGVSGGDAAVSSSSTPSSPGAADVVPAVVATAGIDGSAGAEPGVRVDDRESTILTAHEPDIDVYDEPGGEVSLVLRSADVLTAPDQTPLVMLVTESGEGAGAAGDAGWYEVYLPVRPNGSTGWVRASDVEVDTTRFWISVDLSEFTLTVHEGTDVVLTTQIGVGRDDRPTPGGVYYLKELLKVPNPAGAYGPYAYGLSGFQSTLETFNGGDAVIGIHGTNDDTSFGRVVSSGCMRLPNAVITELAEEIGPPLGTPVYISE